MTSARLDILAEVHPHIEASLGPSRLSKSIPAVTGVSLGSFTYDPTANTDPDTDSNGTTIIVTKP